MSKILKAKEVAELLRLSEATVFKLLGQGKLPGFKIGASWRLDMDELLKFIEKARIVVQPKPRRESRKKHAPQPRLPQETPRVVDQKRLNVTQVRGMLDAAS